MQLWTIVLYFRLVYYGIFATIPPSSSCPPIKLVLTKRVNRFSGYQNAEILSAQFTKSKKWAESCVHRNLLYIGDLNRYMFDLYPGWDISAAYRYYLKALYLKPETGMPHNQLGTLSNSQNQTLDAVYRYLRW